VGDGATARPGQLGPMEPRPPTRHAATLGLGGFCPWRRNRVLFPLAASAIRPRANARRPFAARSQPRPALAEAAQVAKELAEVPDVGTAKAPVALVFDYDSAYAWESQPQGADFDYFQLVFDCYRALRRAGLSVDVVPKSVDPSAYEITFAPGLLTVPESLQGGLVVAGPRAGSKTEEMTIPEGLGPDITGLSTKVTFVESLPPFAPMTLAGGGAFIKWREALETTDTVILHLEEGAPAAVRNGQMIYIAGWPDAAGWRRILEMLAEQAGLDLMDLPPDLRLRETDSHRFWFNYGPRTVTYQHITLPAAAVHWEAK